MRKLTGEAITAMVLLLAMQSWAQPDGPRFDVASTVVGCVLSGCLRCCERATAGDVIFPS